MVRLTVVVLIALAGAITAFIDFSERHGCQLTGQQSSAYHARFTPPVSVTQTSHEVLITRYGVPIGHTAVCLSTAMVGMSGMGYTNTGRQVGPGRYQVNFQFGMAGEYVGHVVVDNPHGSQISIPVKTHVTQPGA